MRDRDNQEVRLRRRKFLLACVAFGLIVPSAFAAEAKADQWLTYRNDRYGTTIDYPDQFKPEPPADADDGRKFKDAQGVEFAVYASYNALDFNLAKYQDFILKNLDPGQVVTYQAHGDNWFVISGTKGDTIFYERHLLSHGGQMTEAFSITYPAAAKQTYDPLVARMSKSLRPGKGFQSP
jgi:serine/threonine-protein kinase